MFQYFKRNLNLSLFQDPNFKSSMVMKRLQSGEKYKIMGKRIAPSGKIEYLIGWEGLHMNDIALID